ncbi:MAG: hypothetical protein ACRD1W_21960, partial [Vicinamibacterales bacterium]
MGVRFLKLFVVICLVAAAIAVTARSPRALEIRKQYAANRVCCDLSLMQALRLTWQEAIGAGPSYPSEIG